MKANNVNNLSAQHVEVLQRLLRMNKLLYSSEREALDAAIAALSALPAAGGEPVAVVIPNVVGVEIAWIDPPSAGRPPVGTKLYTTPQPSAAEPNKTCGVCGSPRIRKHPTGTECMDCRTIHHHHAAVGTQGEFAPTGDPQECETMAEAALLSERALWQDDEGVRWVPEACWQRALTEIERLEAAHAPPATTSAEEGNRG